MNFTVLLSLGGCKQFISFYKGHRINFTYFLDSYKNEWPISIEQPE
jgi:hypothetical protein